MVLGPGEGGGYFREWYLDQEKAAATSESGTWTRRRRQLLQSGTWARRRRRLLQRVVLGPGEGGGYFREWYLDREKAAVDGGVHLTRRDPGGLDEKDL